MGTLFADGYSADELKELFTGREFSEFAQLQLPKSGLFDSKRFRYFLKRHLRAKTFEELKIPMIVVATDLDNGESHEFDSGPIVEAVPASCSIPIILDVYKRQTWKNFVLSTGCDVPPHIPAENIEAFYQALTNFNRSM